MANVEQMESYCKQVSNTLKLRKAYVEGFMKGEVRVGTKLDAMALAEAKYPMPVLSEGEFLKEHSVRLNS